VHAETEAEADENMRGLVGRLQDVSELHCVEIVMEHARHVEAKRLRNRRHDVVVFARARQLPVLEDVMPLECCPGPAGERVAAGG
jgi:hypothetical protein